jgi:hypothetical protein
MFHCFRLKALNDFWEKGILYIGNYQPKEFAAATRQPARMDILVILQLPNSE